MDDNALLVARAAPAYCCPGEHRPIDRATHLGRLASFYPACRECAQRDDIRALTPAQQRQWQQVLRRAPAAPRFGAEGLEAGSVNCLGPKVAAQLAMALGIAAWRERGAADGRPTVLVGSDGHWTTAELMAAACVALQLCGCRTIELGAVTTAALAGAAHHAQADAAWWIGGAAGDAHAMCARVWGPAGRPWSSPGGLNRVCEIYEGRGARPKRGGGSQERLQADAIYLPALGPQFHGLRPLRFVLDTASAPLVRYLEQLASASACQVLRAAPGAIAASAAPGDAGQSPVERRLSAVGRQVVAEHAHFGLWIDPAGELCRLVDECGRAVSHQRLSCSLLSYIGNQRPGATVALYMGDAEFPGSPGDAGVHVVPGAATREGMFDVMTDRGATFGAGQAGAFWFEGAVPAPDALLAASLLLTLFSHTDRPVSEVLDAA
ncbi:MAG: hypothetical protein AB7O59_14615 [Pirellulales bacterium]